MLLWEWEHNNNCNIPVVKLLVVSDYLAIIGMECSRYGLLGKQLRFYCISSVKRGYSLLIQSRRWRFVIKDWSWSLGLFCKRKSHFIAELHKTSIQTCGNFGRVSYCLIRKETCYILISSKIVFIIMMCMEKVQNWSICDVRSLSFSFSNFTAPHYCIIRSLQWKIRKRWAFKKCMLSFAADIFSYLHINNSKLQKKQLRVHNYIKDHSGNKTEIYFHFWCGMIETWTTSHK